MLPLPIRGSVLGIVAFSHAGLACRLGRCCCLRQRLPLADRTPGLPGKPPLLLSELVFGGMLPLPIRGSVLGIVAFSRACPAAPGAVPLVVVILQFRWTLFLTIVLAAFYNCFSNNSVSIAIGIN